MFKITNNNPHNNVAKTSYKPHWEEALAVATCPATRQKFLNSFREYIRGLSSRNKEQLLSFIFELVKILLEKTTSIPSNKIDTLIKKIQEDPTAVAKKVAKVLAAKTADLQSKTAALSAKELRDARLSVSKRTITCPKQSEILFDMLIQELERTGEIDEGFR